MLSLNSFCELAPALIVFFLEVPEQSGLLSILQNAAVFIKLKVSLRMKFHQKLYQISPLNKPLWLGEKHGRNDQEALKDEKTCPKNRLGDCFFIGKGTPRGSHTAWFSGLTPGCARGSFLAVLGAMCDVGD